MPLSRHTQNRSGAARPVGIAARLGSWSAEHRKKAVLGWLVLVLIALAAGNVGSKKLTAADLTSGDSQKAERVLDNAGFEHPATEQVLIQAKAGATVRTAEARHAAGDVIAAVRATGHVDSVRSPTTGATAARSATTGARRSCSSR
jgi:hypothetical protein